MQKYRWLTISVALTLAVVMLWAVPTMAQGYGKGMRGQSGQGWACGQGPGQPRSIHQAILKESSRRPTSS